MQESDDSPTRITVRDQGEAKAGTIKAQCIDGRVLIHFDQEDDEVWLDLAKLDYRWL